METSKTEILGKEPISQEDLQQRVRDEARALFLQRKSQELLTNDELQKLWDLLEKHNTPPETVTERFINYADFKKVYEIAGPKYEQFFSPQVFAHFLENDDYGRISVMNFFNFVMRKVWLHQTRIGLSLYDSTGQGLLAESDLENYIYELIPTLPQLECLEKTFHSFYVCAATRKFMFFLDPLRTGKIKIRDICVSGFLDNLLDLREDTGSNKDAVSADSNWFSAPSALRVYGQYLTLDRDHNGMLSRAELARFGSGTLTPAFLDQVFQVCLTYDGEMDYKAYLDFVLAMESRKTPQALQYFFRILDIDSVGYLNVFTLNYFFRAVQNQIQALGQEPVAFADVKDEIFDMVNPADPTKITLNDLRECGNGDTVVNILIDVAGFWQYENRESQLLPSETGPGSTQEETHV